MTRVKAETKNDISTFLGDAPEEEYTFLLVPVAVYSMVSQVSKKEGCSVGEVFQRALLQYIQASEAPKQRAQDLAQVERSEPAIVVKRKRVP